MKKHLQFSIRTILISATIIALGLFWIRWPMMTASSFVANPAIDAQSIIVDFDTLDDQLERIRHFASEKRKSTVKLIAYDRTFIDMLIGEQRFDYGLYELTVRRGKIGVYGPYYTFGLSKLRR